VDRREAGTRLDLFLVAAFPELSRKRAKRLVDGRKVTVNARIASMASRLLRADDRVEVDFGHLPGKPPPPSVTAVYEDEECVAVAKPPGLPSGPTRDPERPHAQRLAERGTGKPLTLIHRIDKDTSGLLLLGKTPEFSDALAKDFRQRAVEKVYLALVRGRPPGSFEVVSHLREGEGGRMHTVRSGGVRAESRFRGLAESGGYALVEARPQTGRTHQIRIHLAERGQPILGDALYGGAAAVGDTTVPRQMLHAWRLAFRHPVLGREIRIEAPIPGDFFDIARAIFGRDLPPPLAAKRRRRGG
jgi:23S rRNA pseudouridine1911/1915/1917 synthase